MKYMGMPMGTWLLYHKSFRMKLNDALGFDAATAAQIERLAKPRYRAIIAGLPEFEKGDRFKMNLVNAALLAAFYLNMPQRPPLEKIETFYSQAMMTLPTRWFCRMGGRKKVHGKGYRRDAGHGAASGRRPQSLCGWQRL